jgi:hypothetical protein
VQETERIVLISRKVVEYRAFAAKWTVNGELDINKKKTNTVHGLPKSFKSLCEHAHCATYKSENSEGLNFTTEMYLDQERHEHPQV